MYVIIYPYKFSNFLWNKYELGEISKHTEVRVFDLSEFLNKKYSEKLFAEINPMLRIIKVSSMKEFHLQFKNLLNNKTEKIFVLDKIEVTSIRDLIFSIYLKYLYKKYKIKVLIEVNPGIPIFKIKLDHPKKFNIIEKIHRTYNLSTNVRHLMYIVKIYVINSIIKITHFEFSHVLVAGTEYETKIKSWDQKKIIRGHSMDYSNYLSDNLKNKHQINLSNSSITYVDSPDPQFIEDRELHKAKNYLTSEIWYPGLCKFFDHLENIYFLKVKILGHYKTNYSSPNKLFGNRNVIYDKTLDNIKKSKFVISRFSTAISYAVFLRKPILLIYSDQLKNDKNEMLKINFIGDLLGIKPLNINNPIPDLSKYLIVNTPKYEDYENKFITSAGVIKPNFQLILNSFMEIKP